MTKVIFKKPGAGYGFGCFIGDTTEIKDKATIEKLEAAGVVEVVKAEKKETAAEKKAREAAEEAAAAEAKAAEEAAAAEAKAAEENPKD